MKIKDMDTLIPIKIDPPRDFSIPDNERLSKRTRDLLDRVREMSPKDPRIAFAIIARGPWPTFGNPPGVFPHPASRNS
jgi:hypothetical protein